MSLLATIVLLVISYLLWEADLTIFALIAFLVAVLQAFSARQASDHAAAAQAAYAGQRPVIVTTAGGKIPERIKIVTKKHWPGTDLYEDFQTYIGGVVEWPIRILIRLFTGKMGKPTGARKYGSG